MLVGRAGLLGASVLPVPALDLRDAELATAAQACRAMSHQEGERAKRMENPTVRGTVEDAARRYAAAAARFEAARKRA